MKLDVALVEVLGNKRCRFLNMYLTVEEKYKEIIVHEKNHKTYNIHVF